MPALRMMDDEEEITPRQAAAILRRRESNVRKMFRDGTIAARLRGKSADGRQFWRTTRRAIREFHEAEERAERERREAEERTKKARRPRSPLTTTKATTVPRTSTVFDRFRRKRNPVDGGNRNGVQ